MVTIVMKSSTFQNNKTKLKMKRKEKDKLGYKTIMMEVSYHMSLELEIKT